jgi:Uma2 family endonuclease
MISSSLQHLPNSDERPCSDDTPVDNEDQNLLPNLLLFLLTDLWGTRTDWFFAVDMAVYHTTGVNPKIPVVPDAFLSLNVERRKAGKTRRSYATWDENDVVPILILEMVSHKPGGEYEEKMSIYRSLGILYYVIYNPDYWQRDRHQPFEVYRLEQGSYRSQMGEPFWMPEVGLGIGRHQTVLGGFAQEILTWFGETGTRYLNAAEQEELQAAQERLRADQETLRADQETLRADQEKLRADQEQQERQRLEAFLRSQGFDLDNLPG